MQERTFNVVIDDEYAGVRLDKVMVELFPSFSRAFLQRRIKQGRVLVNGVSARPRDLVAGGERLVFELGGDDAADVAEDVLEGEDAPVNVVHDDAELLVVDKPAGVVVHPGAGRTGGTLVNALVFHYPALRGLPRAGVVHRLDKDTSGLLAVAKTPAAHKSLVEQLQARTLGREYLCLVHGVVISGGRIDAPIGRHPRDRKRMAVVADGRAAVTHYRVVERFARYTLLRVRLETGRTHQIRVHAAHLRHPVVGDASYGARRRAPVAGDELSLALRGLKRQFLHACRLDLKHPATGERCEWRSELPEALGALLKLLSLYDAADGNEAGSSD